MGHEAVAVHRNVYLRDVLCPARFQLTAPERVILPLLLPALDSVPGTLTLIVLLLHHVSCVFAGSHLMDALVTGGSHLNFGFVQFVPNLNFEVGLWSRNTLVWLSSCLTLLVIIVTFQGRVDRNFIQSRPKRLICRLHYRFLFIFRMAQSH